MPTYEYACTACAHQWEAEQSMKDDALKDCPACKAETAKRQISRGNGFILKGGGWYSDLYSGASNKSGGASDSGSSDSKSSSSSTGATASTGASSGSASSASSSTGSASAASSSASSTASGSSGSSGSSS